MLVAVAPSLPFLKYSTSTTASFSFSRPHLQHFLTMAEDKPDRITIVAGHPIRRTTTGRLTFTRTKSRDRSVDRSEIESTYDEAFDKPRDVDLRHRQVRNIRLQISELNSNNKPDLQRMAASTVSKCSPKIRASRD